LKQEKTEQQRIDILLGSNRFWAKKTNNGMMIHRCMYIQYNKSTDIYSTSRPQSKTEMSLSLSLVTNKPLLGFPTLLDNKNNK